MTDQVRHLLCFGLGYSARVLARRLAGDGWSISGTARTSQGVDAICASGWNGVLFDGERSSEGVREALGRATHVLVSVPPGSDGDPVLRWHEADIDDAPKLNWIGYLSTVGVYGDHGGAVVDEETPPQPASVRGQRRLEAERAWLALEEKGKRRVEVFRLPGIYGPGRSAIETVTAGTARRLIKPGQVFNRIHVADIAGALAAAMLRPTGHRVYNLADDEPSPPQDVIAFAAKLLGLPVPPDIPFETAQLTPMARSFYGELKRVSNARMRTALGYDLQFPTYREGLRAIATAAQQR